MGASRLATAYPDLDQAIRAAPPDRAIAAAWAVAQWAIRKTGLSHRSISDASADGPVGAVAALAAQLDERYFELQELCEEGECSQEQVLAAFQVARAAAALEFAIRGESSEAIYEAASCCDDLSELRRAVDSALK